jgi:hypothetical protein
MHEDAKIFEAMLVLEKSGQTLSYEQIQCVGDAIRQISVDDSAYALVRLFPAYYPPTPENVKLLTRFLGDDAHEQSRKGAVIGADHYWSLAGVDLDLISRIASPEFMEIDDTSMWFALSALGSAAVENREARKKLLKLAERAIKFSFEDRESRRLYLKALRDALHVAQAGHDAVLLQLDEKRIPSIEESINILKTKR